MQVGGSGADEERAISGEGERRARQEGSSSSEAYLKKNNQGPLAQKVDPWPGTQETGILFLAPLWTC